MNYELLASGIDFLGVALPIVMSVVVIFLSAVTNKKIENQVKENAALRFSDSFSKMEYDISEILQLCVIKAKHIEYDNRKDVMKEFPYFIPYFRDKDSKMPPTNNPQERIYRLCGYVCTYGKKEAVYLFNALQNEYSKWFYSEFDYENVYKIIAILALLVTQIKNDAYRETFNYKEWINIRLPMFKDYEKETIFNHCEEISKLIKNNY